MKVKFGKEKQELIFKLSSFLPLEIELKNCTITVSLSEPLDKSEDVVDNPETDLEECKEFWENGQLRRQYHHVNGVFEGEFKWWREDGQLKGHCYYKNGKFDGEFKMWGVGKLLGHELWENGKYVKSLL